MFLLVLTPVVARPWLCTTRFPSSALSHLFLVGRVLPTKIRLKKKNRVPTYSNLQNWRTSTRPGRWIHRSKRSTSERSAPRPERTTWNPGGSPSRNLTKTLGLRLCLSTRARGTGPTRACLFFVAPLFCLDPFVSDLVPFWGCFFCFCLFLVFDLFKLVPLWGS